MNIICIFKLTNHVSYFLINLIFSAPAKTSFASLGFCLFYANNADGMVEQIDCYHQGIDQA